MSHGKVFIFLILKAKEGVDVERISDRPGKCRDQMAQRCSAQALRSRLMRTSPMASRGSVRVISIAVTNSQPSSL